jgi:hypothetical protein
MMHQAWLRRCTAATLSLATVFALSTSVDAAHSLHDHRIRHVLTHKNEQLVARKVRDKLGDASQEMLT